MDKKYIIPNKYIELKDFELFGFKSIVDDIHSFLKVPPRKRLSYARCRGDSLIEPAVFESYKHWDNPWALSNAHLKPGMKILDCGSGRGVLQFYISGMGVEVHAIDISDLRSRQIKRIRKTFRKLGITVALDPKAVHRKLNRKYKVNVQFKQESAASLSFPDNFFDRIFCISVIEHMNEHIIEKSMKEMERVLKPEGILLLTFDFHPTPDDMIIGFTENEFRLKVLEKCSLKVANNEPDFSIDDWETYIERVNTFFKTKNPNTSYGIVLEK